MKYIGLWTEWRNKILHVMKCTLENLLALFYSIMTFSVLLHDFFEKKLLKFFWLVNGWGDQEFQPASWPESNGSKTLSMTMYLWAKNFSHFLLLKKIMLIYMAIGHYKGCYILYILQHASNFWKKILYLPSSISSSKPCLKIVTNIHT